MIAYKKLLIGIVIFFPLLAYVVWCSRTIELIVENKNEFPISYIFISTCNIKFSVTTIDKLSTIIKDIRPKCEGSYNLSYKDDNGKIIEFHNLGYVGVGRFFTKHKIQIEGKDIKFSVVRG